MIFKVSTTGAVQSVPFPDLGLRTLDHPTVELDLGLEYSDDELLSSKDLENAISNGWIVVVESSGVLATQDYVDEKVVTTISGAVGGSVATFTGLADTPDAYEAGKYLRTTASGFVYEDEYITDLIYIQSGYEGEDSDGSFSHPFKTLAEAAVFADLTYAGTGKNVAVKFHPGVYEVPHKIILNTIEIKSFIGTGSKTTIIKPTADLLGQSFIDIYTPLEAVDITIDATDIPEFATTEGSAGCINFR